MKNYPNLLIIAGTGRNSGKTTLACRIIEKFCHISPAAIKISPHFHQTTEGLVSIHINTKFNIYRETSGSGRKDSSRMLQAGASEVFFIQSYDDNVETAFEMIYRKVEPEVPVICESPSLGKYIDPAVLFIADNKELTLRKTIESVMLKADLMFYPLNEEPDLSSLFFSSGRWCIR